MQNKKKMLIIYILKVLTEFSDEQHLLKQKDIIEKLDKIYNLKVARNAVSRNITSLIDAGYDIIKKSQGVYIAERNFDNSEIDFLITAIYSTKSISNVQAQRLIKKLLINSSNFDKDRFQFVHCPENLNQINRTSNKQIFYNIDKINTAIIESKQISFIYNKYDLNKNLVPRKDKKYIVNPYFLVNSLGKFYLVCNYNKYTTLSNYRIDFITDLEVLDSNAKPKGLIYGYENGIDQTKYVNEHIYMFGGKTITAYFELNNENVINDVVDWFGNNVQFSTLENKLYATITANETALYYWAIQYGENVTLKSPNTLLNKLKSFGNMFKEKYIE